MFDRQALQGFARTLTVQTEGVLPEVAKKALAETAQAELARVLRGDPKPTSYRQIVDGKEGVPFIAVRPDGQIILAFQYLQLVVQDTYGALLNRLPKRSGLLRDSVIILADGALVTLDEIPQGVREVRLVVEIDYARRIEVGRKRHTHAWFSAEGHGAVQETAITSQKLFRTAAKISFGYTATDRSPTLSEAARHRRYWTEGIGWRVGAKRKRFGVEETVMQFPSIIIRPLSA